MLNYGVIEEVKDTDYFAGSLSYKEVNPSGDWRPYLPKKENQSSSGGDSMACVTFSALNCIEAQERLLTGREPNYSDRWIAKMSDTTPQGNTLQKVMDTIRQYGLVEEDDYPTPDTYTFEEYHAPISEIDFLKLKGKFWKSVWDVQYEWIKVEKESFLYHLKQAPVQIIIPGHAVMLFSCNEDVVNYFDTYNPFEKQAPYNNIRYAMKIVLTPKNQMTNVKLIKIGNELGYWMPCTSPEALVSYGENFGKPIPKKEDGSVNFDLIKPDYTI